MVTEPLEVKVKRIHKDTKLPELPVLATEGSAGYDLYAYLGDNAQVLLPRNSTLIRTGLAFEIPQGYEMQVRPRSGLALHSGITVLNSPGTIDSDYRDEVCVILINHSHELRYIRHGERIAQAVFAPVLNVKLSEVQEIETTGRGGFGSTGK